MQIKKRSPQLLLLLIAIGTAMSFAIWLNLLNNFAIERAHFTGSEIGILQSLREIPGLLAFTLIFVLLLIREQRMSYISLILLGIGTALAGFFPIAIGFYFTTILMSIGFHYLETLQNSLSLQWIDKKQAPEFFGQLIAAKSAAS
ncbi:MAG TPA: MFS transporter, partial [Leucothrix mucor]|nr:MFS transporter [Leucothrix mucor]